MSDQNDSSCPVEPNPQDNALVRIRLVNGATPAGWGCGAIGSQPTYPGAAAGSVDIEVAPSRRRIPTRVAAPSGSPWDDRYLEVGGANGTRGFGITIGLGRDGRVAAAILTSIYQHDATP